MESTETSGTASRGRAAEAAGESTAGTLWAEMRETVRGLLLEIPWLHGTSGARHSGGAHPPPTTGTSGRAQMTRASSPGGVATPQCPVAVPIGEGLPEMEFVRLYVPRLGCRYGLCGSNHLAARCEGPGPASRAKVARLLYRPY